MAYDLRGPPTNRFTGSKKKLLFTAMFADHNNFSFLQTFTSLPTQPPSEVVRTVSFSPLRCSLSALCATIIALHCWLGCLPFLSCRMQTGGCQIVVPLEQNQISPDPCQVTSDLVPEGVPRAYYPDPPQRHNTDP